MKFKSGGSILCILNSINFIKISAKNKDNLSFILFMKFPVNKHYKDSLKNSGISNAFLHSLHINKL